MADKSVKAVITAEDIQKIVDRESDFGFEMRILNKLIKQMGFRCTHGWTYIDPIKGRDRQYDIQAKKQIARDVRLHMSVECKNLRENSPLIIHAAQRTREEAFHYILEHKLMARALDDGAMKVPALVQTVTKHLTSQVYAVGMPVGKSMDQAASDGKGGWTRKGDGDVFERYSQAISSFTEMISSALVDRTPNAYDAFLPIVVVPDGRLWRILYSKEGSILEAAKNVDHVTYFVGKNIRVNDPLFPNPFVLSHLEVVTETGLSRLIESYFNDDNEFLGG